MMQIPINEKYCTAYSQLEALSEQECFSTLRISNQFWWKSKVDTMELLRRKWQNSYLEEKTISK